MNRPSGLAARLAKAPVDTLAECLACLEKGTVPATWAGRKAALASERGHLDALLAESSVWVYGANTLVGHRDAERVSDVDTAAEDLLATRAIGGPPRYSAHAARCIG